MSTTAAETKVGARLDRLCIDTIRTLAMDAVERANSGHPGAPMGAAPMAYVLWDRYLKHDPAAPEWFDRDRFVLSAGHASMLLYALLHLTGYDLSLEDLKSFRRWASRTPGHPEYGLTPGVETTTGPLGQGFSTGVGMAMAERFLAERFNGPRARVVDHFIYGIVSDGDLMEGMSGEAASLAGHLRLGKLVYLYDSNNISIDGPTDLSFTEDVAMRFAAYGWHVQRVLDGNDLDEIDMAIAAARADERPSLIVVATHIGYGAPNKQDTAEAHGAPLGADEVRAAKRNLGWPEDEEFLVPEEVLAHMRRALERGERARRAWEREVDRLERDDHGEGATFRRILSGELPEGWEAALPEFSPDDGKMATRQASGVAINALAPHVPELVGGSADLTPSNNTSIKEAEVFSPGTAGRKIHFGVREHAMGAALNGMTLHGLRAFGGTFLTFSDYMRPAIRLAALMEIPTIFVFTHDSIGLGEDGPTHQPIEHVMSLRAIPNLAVIRPADANETAAAWRVLLSHRAGPAALCLSRQGLPVLRRPDGSSPPVERGAYVLLESAPDPDAILIATGSEVHPALRAAEVLADEGTHVRVVSMPSWELFEQQSEEYREEVLPPRVAARVAVEAGVTQGWCRWVGPWGEVVGLDRFGASAPGDIVMERLGFTPERIMEAARRSIRKARGKVPHPVGAPVPPR